MSSAVRGEVTPLLEECDSAMDELEDKCCVPGRSPQMATLRRSLAEIRLLIDEYEVSASANEAVEMIKNVGSQVGRLQVTCCAPSRMPLYDTLLHNLMQVQRTIKRDAKLAH